MVRVRGSIELAEVRRQCRGGSGIALCSPQLIGGLDVSTDDFA
jgi:hypothetical protein